jgi:hypothetical protein
LILCARGLDSVFLGETRFASLWLSRLALFVIGVIGGTLLIDGLNGRMCVLVGVASLFGRGVSFPGCSRICATFEKIQTLHLLRVHVSALDWPEADAQVFRTSFQRPAPMSLSHCAIDLGGARNFF